MNLKRLLCTFSGDDYSIISQCDKSIQNRFMAIGVFVSLIFTICFLSSYFSFTMLFQNIYIGIPIGIFFAFMITNIYLLLLYTLSKNSFPNRTDKFSKSVSIVFRVLFICFIAIIVSKPLETIFYKNVLNKEIENYKVKKVNQYNNETEKYFNQEVSLIQDILNNQSILGNRIDADQITYYNDLIKTKRNEEARLKLSMSDLVDKSNYYIQGISILNTKYKSCWLITLLSILIFLFPAYLKNFLGENSTYYESKKSIENQLVQEEYNLFKKRYKLIYKEEYKISLEFSESFSDAPFNTKRKTDEREFLKEDDLISDLYNV